MELTEEVRREIENWMLRIEDAARVNERAADTMNSAAQQMEQAANKFSHAAREIPSYIRTGD